MIEILRIRNEMGNGTADFQKYKAEKMTEMARMESEIKYIHVREGKIAARLEFELIVSV